MHSKAFILRTLASLLFGCLVKIVLENVCPDGKTPEGYTLKNILTNKSRNVVTTLECL